MPVHITQSAQETRQIAKKFAENLCGGDIILLEGNLGSGKTTFVQGILETLNAKRPYTSPTFVIMKTYSVKRVACSAKPDDQDTEKNSDTLRVTRCALHTVHHIDTYRVKSYDLLNLGWEEMIQEKNSVILLEWPDHIRDILPDRAKTILFSHVKKDVRRITLPR